MTLRSDRLFVGLAILAGCSIALVDGRSVVPGFPARAVILACFLLGWMRPSRPWQGAAIISGILLLAHLFRATPLSDWYWMQVHSVSWFGRFYDLLGTPTPSVLHLWSKAISFFPGLAAALLGCWGHDWALAYRTRTREQ